MRNSEMTDEQFAYTVALKRIMHESAGIKDHLNTAYRNAWTTNEVNAIRYMEDAYDEMRRCAVLGLKSVGT